MANLTSVPSLHLNQGWLLLRRILRSPQIPWVLVLTLLLAFGWAMPAARLFDPPSTYLPFHTVLEFVAMAISAMVFALSWNLWWQGKDSRRIILGAGFLAVCLIDLGHTLSFSGMPALVTPSGTEKAINFWLTGRLLSALTLLAFAALPTKSWSLTRAAIATACALVLSAAFWWAALYRPDLFPSTFVVGVGLTSFKIGCEYALTGLYALAAVLLLVRAQRGHAPELHWLAAAAWVLGLGELFLTMYVDVTDLFNLLGHAYKATAYLMIYRGLFVSGIERPYQQLGFERARLKALVETIPDLVWLKDQEGVYLACNPQFERLFGAREGEIIGKTDYDFVDQELADFFRANDRAAILAGKPRRNEE